MPANRVEQILADVGTIAFPGIFDTLSARIAEQVGFPMAFVSGYSVAATTIGEPDFGLLTQTEMVQAAGRICSSVNIPVIVDADTGYGNPLNVFRTVKQLISAGAAGCFLEDQVWPKRCGHMKGKQVIESEEYLHKIHAAVDARGDQDFFIVARTDSLAIHGLDDAISRVRSAREAGANASFVEAPENLEQLTQIGRQSPAPNVANMIEGGRTPVLSKEELTQLGFTFILYPLCGLFSAAKTIEKMYHHLMHAGTTVGSGVDLMDFEQFNSLIGVEEKYARAQKYGAS